MGKHWKDPDTSVVHVIKQQTRHDVAKAEHLSTFILLPDAPSTYSRTVTMACGVQHVVDCDEFIVPGEFFNGILRPWLTCSDAPTCLVCAASRAHEHAYRNDWKIIGA